MSPTYWAAARHAFGSCIIMSTDTALDLATIPVEENSSLYKIPSRWNDL